MALSNESMLRIYRDLNRVFPEDLHISRPLILMMQTQGDMNGARDLAITMARRMLSKGRPSDSLGFLEICKVLDHPDTAEIEAMASIAKLTSRSPMELETSSSRTFMLVDNLSDYETRDFLEHGDLVEVLEGRDVVKQDEVNRNFYLILEGSMRVHLTSDNGRQIHLNILEPGQFFGEFACVYKLPRSATVTAAEDSLLLEFSDRSIKELMVRSPIAGDRLMKIVQFRLFHSMSYSHPAMTELPETDRKWLAEESRLREFDEGSIIFSDNDREERCYIIVYGDATARHIRSGNPVDMTMHKGEMFGNMHAYLALPPMTTIRASSRCLVCSVPKEVFKSFMNAYGSFEQWVETHGMERMLKLQGET